MTTGLANLTHPRFDAIEQHPDVGPCILYSDGYLTIDLGAWHFHLCVGPHSGSPSPELREKRPVAKAAFFERRGKGCDGEDQKLLRDRTGRAWTSTIACARCSSSARRCR